MKAIVPCLAIIVLGGLEIYALRQGIDGALFSTVAAIIGGLAGYKVATTKETKK